MDQSKKTPAFDWPTMQFVTNQGRVITATGTDAVKEILTKAQQTARGIYLNYANTEDVELNHKYGSDVGDVVKRSDLTEEARISELKRAIKDALVYDPWIVDVYDICIDRHANGEVIATYTVSTVFDTEILEKGVTLNE
jgi:hypothetical protein